MRGSRPEAVLFQNGTRQYLRVKSESIRVDVWVAGVSASCYGVNLAVSVLECGLFSSRYEAVLVQNR